MQAALDPTDDDIDRAHDYERELRHDVMAHVHAFGDAAPAAAGIIHLGATSQFINCNAEAVIHREALDLVCCKLAGLVLALADFAKTWRGLPCLAMTHLQPSQPTTLGKRASVWAYDLSLCLSRLERTRNDLRLRGVKGATGAQASFLALFDGDGVKVDALDTYIIKQMGFSAGRAHVVTGQTYPRVVDAHLLSELASTAACVHKLATDLRILCSRKEVDEPFGDKQIGSSAMPYKRNPMRCERATGLARFVMSLAQNAYDTAATQWLERTLDDSANRRLSIPESFLATDAILDLMRSVAAGLDVHEAMVRTNLEQELPFLASENLLMAAARLGRDRQQAHEVIRQAAQQAARKVKEEGVKCDLIERLRGESMFQGVDFNEALDPSSFVGLAPQQVDRFLREVAEPIRGRYKGRVPALNAPSV